jgi:vacuolar-type H+-ATPase subunit H
VSRLTELLERIRPAGVPGAAAEGQPPVDRAAADELAALTGVLAELEAQADEVVARGRRRAERLRVDADRREERIRGEQPERVAVARAEVEQDHERRGAAEAARLTEAAQREAVARRRAADARIDDVVTAAVDRIWQLVGAADEEREP